jgi:hypothetical protein
MKLGEVAYARSGDKGANANVGVACRNRANFETLRTELTAERVATYFKDLPITDVVRYELPNLAALNFILKNALDGGVARSLRMDPQGKTLGESLMMMELTQDSSLWELA